MWNGSIDFHFIAGSDVRMTWCVRLRIWPRKNWPTSVFFGILLRKTSLSIEKTTKNSRKIQIAGQWAQLPLNPNFYDEISLFHLSRDEHLWLMFHQSAATERWLGHKSSSTKKHAWNAKTTSRNQFDETKRSRNSFFSFSSSATPFFSSNQFHRVYFWFYEQLSFIFGSYLWFIFAFVDPSIGRSVVGCFFSRYSELAIAPRAPFFGSVERWWSIFGIEIENKSVARHHRTPPRDCPTHSETRNSAAKPVSRGALSTKRSGSIRMVGSFLHLYWEFPMCGHSAVLATNGDCNIWLEGTDDDRNVARLPFVQLSGGVKKNEEEFSLALTRLGALQYRNETRFPCAGHTRAIQIEWNVIFFWPELWVVEMFHRFVNTNCVEHII